MIYVTSVIVFEAKMIFHLEPSHSTISLALATNPLPSLLRHATEFSTASSLPTSSNNKILIPEALIDLGSNLVGSMI